MPYNYLCDDGIIDDDTDQNKFSHPFFIRVIAIEPIYYAQLTNSLTDVTGDYITIS